MRRLRNIALIIAWAGFVWMLFSKASDREISDLLWVNLAYLIALILFAIAVIAFSISADVFGCATFLPNC